MCSLFVILVTSPESVAHGKGEVGAAAHASPGNWHAGPRAVPLPQRSAPDFQQHTGGSSHDGESLSLQEYFKKERPGFFSFILEI